MDEMKYVHVLENGDIRLSPKEFDNKVGSSVIIITTVTFSYEGFVFRWIIDCLEKRWYSR